MEQLVELMHGHIDLHSTLGSGTKAVFNVPFNKAPYLSDDSPLVDLSSIPDRLQSDVSLSYASSDERASPSVTPSGEEEGSPQKKGGASTPNAGTPPKHGALDSSADISDNERQGIHVLVVEDKYVRSPVQPNQS